MLEEISTHVLGGFVYRTIGAVSPSTREVAEDMISELSLMAPRAVTRARLKIHHDENRPTAEEYLAQGSMEVTGRRVRSEAAASTAEEALNLVGRGLDRRLQMLSERKQRASRRPPATPAGLWRRNEERTPRPRCCERSAEERLLLRRKTFRANDTMSIEEAVLSLTLLEFRMFLFTDETEDVGSVVYETGAGVALRRVDGSLGRELANPQVKLDNSPAPRLTTADAINGMNVTGNPFLYFQDLGRYQPGAIYRRFDGHYGLIAAI
jgi:ribosome-associated translation inhibitor RaiA